MRIVAAARSDRGFVRTNNEDAFHVDPSPGLMVVADGMGGHASGEVASQLAVSTICACLDRRGGPPPLPQSPLTAAPAAVEAPLRVAVVAANRAIYEAAERDPVLHGMGTTVDVVLIADRRVRLGHVGDGRVYLLRDRCLSRLTEDHSLVFEQVRRELITAAQAGASLLKHILTRAVGMAPDVAVDLIEIVPAAGDRLLLCTDGLTGQVSDPEIQQVLEDSPVPEEACRRLVALANGRGGADNVTVAAAYLDGEGC
jgi:protein phosphatase